MSKATLKKGALLVGGGIVCLVLIIGIVLTLGLLPAKGATQHFEISDGEGRVSIARRLQEQGIIRSRHHFVGASIVMGRTMKAGVYDLDPNQSLVKIVEAVTSVDQTVRVTVPEGYRREQIAQLLTEKGLSGTEFLQLTEGKEGYLFPDTYFVTPGSAAIKNLVALMEKTFDEKTAGLNITKADVILASIVEREAKKDIERALIAGIYKNRLNQGIKLDADPTVQFARDNNLLAAGQTVDTFWKGITLADYQGVGSSYNTYRNTGLPPGPIANPGLKSLQAAKNPESTNAIFFFHTADGSIITSRTLEEHNANKRKYL